MEAGEQWRKGRGRKGERGKRGGEKEMDEGREGEERWGGRKKRGRWERK